MNLEKIAKKGAFLIIIGDSIVGLRRDYESAIENAIDTYGNNGTTFSVRREEMSTEDYRTMKLRF